MKSVFLVMAVLFVILFVSCGIQEKDLKTAVDKTSYEMDVYYIHLHESVVKLADFTSELFKNQNKYDLSINKMDEKEGGKYKFFQKVAYYKYTNDGGMSVLATGAVPVTDLTKKRIRLFEYAEKTMISLIQFDSCN